MSTTAGLHHITAMAGNARGNVAFYTEVLGLRMIKKTVNFDDPSTYHLYYGDEQGSPGTILTFFPWENARQGKHGAGEASQTAYAVPVGALEFWQERFAAHDVPAQPISTLFGERVLRFSDPDGLMNHLVETAYAKDMHGFSAAGVPTDHAIRGFSGITLWSRHPAETGKLLEIMGYALHAREGDIMRWQAAGSELGNCIDVRDAQKHPPAQMGAGSIHHVAFRAHDDAAQAAMAQKLVAAGAQVTEQRDRQYFRSVYFREPGGVLFEIATDAPGFTIDETAETLGTSLMLPAWLENRRAAIEASLPSLH